MGTGVVPPIALQLTSCSDQSITRQELMTHSVNISKLRCNRVFMIIVVKGFADFCVD